MFNILKEASFTARAPPIRNGPPRAEQPGRHDRREQLGGIEFTTWTAAFGNNTSANILNHNAVVHLVTDDVYLDLRFTSFQGGGSGGGFAYERSTAVPEPAAVVLAGRQLTSLVVSRRRRYTSGFAG